MLFDFFIAHAGPDRQIAEDLYDRLTGLGGRCFLDSRDLRLGDDWDLALRKAQSESRATIILVSTNCDRSFYQREEIASAISLSRMSPEEHRVIPVYLEDITPEAIPYGLRIKHGLYIAAESDPENVAPRIMQSLGPARPGAIMPMGLITYEIDLCMCIDLSNSLNWLLGLMRRQLLTLGHDIVYKLANMGKATTRLRVSLVTFAHEDAPIARGPMIELPSGAATLYEQVLGLRLLGGGPFRSRGLEALQSAMTLDWSPGGVKRRHIIAVWTDRPTVGGLDLDELTNQWEDMDLSAKRLVLFVPDAPSWNRIATEWENVVMLPVEAGPVTDEDYDTILGIICSSV